MNPNDPLWQPGEPDNLTRGRQPDPLDELWPPQGEYLTQAEMAEFLDTLGELLHRMVEICTTLAKSTNHNQTN